VNSIPTAEQAAEALGVTPISGSGDTLSFSGIHIRYIQVCWQGYQLWCLVAKAGILDDSFSIHIMLVNPAVVIRNNLWDSSVVYVKYDLKHPSHIHPLPENFETALLCKFFQ